MFDLDQQVQSWRSQLLHRESVSSSEVDELESHLRDSVAKLGRGELSTEEAFLVACRRVGSPEALALEFTKINGARTWIHRTQWMLAGYLSISLLLSVMGTLSRLLAMIAVHFQLPLWVVMVASSTGATACVVLLVLWAWSATTGQSRGMQYVATRFSSLARSNYRWWLLLAVLCLLVLKSLFHAGAQVVITQLFSPSEFGATAIVVASTNWLGDILLLTTVVGLLCWLISLDAGATERWKTSKVITATFGLAVFMLAAFGLMSIGVRQMFGEDTMSYFQG